MFFIVPGLSIGGNMILTSASVGDYSATEFAIGPKAAYFFGDPDGNLFPFFGASFLYNKYSSDSDNEYSQTSFQFSGGFAYMIVSHISLTGEALFKFTNNDPDGFDSYSSNTFGVLFGIAAFIY
jgi:hypothetical protein